MTNQTWFNTAVALVILNVLTACSVISNVASYSVTDREIEQGLMKEIDKLTDKTAVAGVPVILEVSDLLVMVGPDERPVVAIEANAMATVSVFGLNYPATVKLALEGEPYYNRDEKALYVRSLSLTRSEIDAGGFKGNLTLVATQFMAVFNEYLSTHPVYQIDTSRAGLGWLATMPLSLQVVPGKIVFKPEFSEEN